MFYDVQETGVTFVGAPIEVVRTTDTKYLDQARSDFVDYVHKTLAASQANGGRYNPPGEFGALYSASDEDTAWEEIAARYRREGITGLPPAMGLLRIIVGEGQYVDLTDSDTRELWDVDQNALSVAAPTPGERDACHEVGRRVRVIADFLQAPSARATGANVPLFPDREGSTLRYALAAARETRPPDHFLQTSRETW